MNNRMDNYVESVFRELTETTDESAEYDELYGDFATDRLTRLFSTLHSALLESLKSLNTCLPTRAEGGYFWADNSRRLLSLIDVVQELKGNLDGDGYAFEVDDYYSGTLEWCSSFLAQTWGSQIPPNSKKIVLPYTSPMFIPSRSSGVHEVPSVAKYGLKLIGEGSYAKVFKYKDEHYDKFFAIKRAKEGLSEKDYERFAREYEVLRSLRSPHVVEVYRFDEVAREYVMEYIGCTLEEYIQKNGNKLAFRDRRRLVLQFLNAVQYLNDKGCLHRDLSPRNVLLKEYEDAVVLKLSDLGMVKVEGSMLTSAGTEFRGSFNDPALRRDGFSKYAIEHEIYAATLLVFYIMTGRRNLERPTHAALEEFVKVGTSPLVEERYRDIGALRQAFLRCCREMGE